jgi:SAM-dependent methyltransferase
MTSPRLDPPFWRHDAYTLRRLALAIRSAAARLLPPGRPATVVDIGAGDAPYRALFAPERTRYVCCDLEDGAEVRIASGSPIPLPDRHADVVVSFQVLEHVWDLDWYLGEARRLLKDDGSLLLSTHGTWLFHPHPTDFRRWTRDGLVREIESRGFAVQSIEPAVGPLAWTTQFRLLGYHAVLSRVPLLGGLLFKPLALLMYLRMVLEDAVTPPALTATNAAIYIVVAKRSPAPGDAPPVR